VNISVVRTTADAPNKDPAIARLAETEPKVLRKSPLDYITIAVSISTFYVTWGPTCSGE
jgi:hypothetical protein